MALGGTPLQDARRRDRGRARGTSTRERRTREAGESRPCRRLDRADDRHRPSDAGRHQARRAPWSRECGRNDVRRDARVIGSPGAARQRPEARSPAWRRSRGTSDEAGSAPTRRSASCPAARALSAADRPVSRSGYAPRYLRGVSDLGADDPVSWLLIRRGWEARLKARAAPHSPPVCTPPWMSRAATTPPRSADTLP